MSKHDTRTAYPAQGLAAAEAALLTLWPALSSYHQDLVLVGGLAVHYLIRHGSASPWPGVVTMDVDFGIELSADCRCGLRSQRGAEYGRCGVIAP